MSHSNSSRKSLAGKRHVPYHNDKLHGRRTGLEVAQVDRDSDGIEPFDKVLEGADGRTPHAAKKRRKRDSVHVNGYDYDDDDGGEMSMEMDNSQYMDEDDLPNRYFRNTTRSAPESSRQVGSSSKPLPRPRSDVDYDRLPSPGTSSSQKSHRRESRPLTQSRSSRHSLRAPSPEIDMDDAGADDFAAQEQADDSEGDNEAEPAITPRRLSKADKGKGRAPPSPEADPDEPEDQDIEDVAQNLVPSDEDEDDPEPSSRSSVRKGKSRSKSKKAFSTSKSQSKSRGKPKSIDGLVERVTADGEDSEDTHINGVRRGTRFRYAPLEWWRCEKVVYGQKQNGRTAVPTIKEIIRIPKEDPQPLGKRKGTGGHKRKRSEAPKDEGEENGAHVVYVPNPEEGWDIETEPHGVVTDFESGTDAQRRVVFTARMVKARPAGNNEFSFQKIFGDSDFIAAGQLIIPPGKEKPTKGSKDNTYVFYLVEGAVQFYLHQSSYLLTTGSMMMVPRGNRYSIKNVCERSVKLFFAQARKVPVPLSGTQEGGSSPSRRRSSTRGISARPSAGSSSRPATPQESSRHKSRTLS